MISSVSIDKIIELLPNIKKDHAISSDLYQNLKLSIRSAFEEIYNSKSTELSFKPFGNLYFPYFYMGSVDSLNFFDIDEMIIYSFYWANKNKYKTVLDLGANIGIHSIILNRCGYSVKSFEPDPVHFSKLQENLKNNGYHSDIYNVAVSSKNGKMEFVRVLGNTTGSHLKGSKANPYGKLEYFDVEVVSFKDILKGVDLVKMDIEGHEKEVILSTTSEDWKGLDMLVEVGNEHNAHDIFNHASFLGLNLFSQKIGWDRVNTINEVPCSYKEGTLFITQKDEMHWA